MPNDTVRHGHKQATNHHGEVLVRNDHRLHVQRQAMVKAAAAAVQYRTELLVVVVMFTL